MRRAMILPIRGWQVLVAPFLAPRCRYYPSCSAYAIGAIREFGAVRGVVLAAWRLLRCNPWSHGGWDPVSDRKLFAPDESDVAKTHKHEAHA